MDLAAQACPPDSYARNVNSTEHFEAAEASYKHELGGFVTNFNLSSDLCTCWTSALTLAWHAVLVYVHARDA